jgi:Tol biopolymer transport system component
LRRALQRLLVLQFARGWSIVVDQEELAMLCSMYYARKLIPLLSSLLLVLEACSPNTPVPKPTPTAHLVSTLSPGNGGGTGRIALACAPDPAQNKADICVSNLDGSGLRRLTSGPGPNISPAWSPDGQRLVFRAADAQVFEASDIWLMNADGSQQTNLTNDQQSNWGATWAPDGKHILFNSVREGGGMPHLYLMNLDGSGLRRLCPHSSLWEEYPDWSPDGTKIAFMSNVGFSAWVIYVMNADCSGLRQVTNGPGEDSTPRWSPDGKKIAFTSDRTGQAEVYLMNGDGSQQTRLTTSPKDTSFNGPDWSPDGAKLLYLHSLANGGEIWVMNADGSAQTKLMDAYGFGDSPVWQP